MHTIHGLFCISMCLSSFGVAYSTTPIYSVLFLILTFVQSAGVLFILNVEFLGLIFIIIYVGAVAVLFLFIVMMINIKSTITFIHTRRGIVGALICLVFFFIFIYLFRFNKLFLIDYINNTVFLNIFNVYDTLNNLEVIGQVLYNSYLCCVFLSGIILLVALVGSIVLTIHLNSLENGQGLLKQLSRVDNCVSFFRDSV